MNESAKLLRNGLLELGFIPSEEQIHAFLIYLSELKKWNKAYNLTGLKKDEDIVIKHFLDSLLYLKIMPEGEIRVADVGSGAGFPGIPIKIIRPEVEMYLIEPSGKKSTFLGYMIQKLKLVEIDVIEKRIEDIRIRHELAQSVDVAVTRALFTVKEFVKKTSHILKTGGILILSKGPKGIEEIKGLGDITYHLMDLKLPLSDIMRHMIVVKR